VVNVAFDGDSWPKTEAWAMSSNEMTTALRGIFTLNLVEMNRKNLDASIGSKRRLNVGHKQQTARNLFRACGPSGGLFGIDQEVVTLRGLSRQLPGQAEA